MSTLYLDKGAWEPAHVLAFLRDSNVTILEVDIKADPDSDTDG
jgi:hypothetical protein